MWLYYSQLGDNGVKKNYFEHISESKFFFNFRKHQK